MEHAPRSLNARMLAPVFGIVLLLASASVSSALFAESAASTEDTLFPTPTLSTITFAGLPSHSDGQADMFAIFASTFFAQPNDWRVGSIVNLKRGTQIRRGPGIGFCYHTVVPEDEWAVKVIDGPRYADGHTWYDTSRRDAGDPSGGTGWVDIAQADSAVSPAASDGGSPCAVSTTQPGSNTFTFQVPTFLIEITVWWNSQPGWARIGVLLVAILLLPVTARLYAFGGGTLVGLARAVLWGVILAATADLTRAIWLDSWQTIVGGQSGVDPILVLLVLPLAWWAFGLLSQIAARSVALVGMLILLLLFLYLVVPDRLTDLLNQFRR